MEVTMGMEKGWVLDVLMVQTSRCSNPSNTAARRRVARGSSLRVQAGSGSCVVITKWSKFAELEGVERET